MTPRMIDFVRAIAWSQDVRGSVLEIGSYIEANQEHLNLRQAFPRGTSYLGVDLLEGPGVDRRVDLLNRDQMGELLAGFTPSIVLCLYVVEHMWDIRGAFEALGALWRRCPESWLFVATHQNQPFHGTDKYPDYWRLTAPGMLRAMEEAGLSGTRIFVHPDRSNPEDVVAVRQPASIGWAEEALGLAVQSMIARWERYC